MTNQRLNAKIPQEGLLDFRGPTKKKRSPGQRARDARRLAQLAEATARQRQKAWAEGAHPNLVEEQTRALYRLYGRKRQLLREIYGRASKLEGQDVNRRPARIDTNPTLPKRAAL